MNSALLTSRKTKPIGLTALIDVVFILLLFFMLTSSFKQWKSIDLQAPATVSNVEKKQPTIVTLKSNAMVTLENKSWSLVQLSQLNKQQLVNYDRQSPLVVFPESSTTVQTIVNTLEVFKGLGFQQVTLGNSIKNSKRLKNLP